MLQCPACDAENPRDAKFCETCGGSIADLAASTRMADEAEAEVMLLEVKKARGALAIVAGLQIALGLIYLAIAQIDATTAGIIVAIGVVFLGLWAWAKQNPLAASIVGLVLFATLHGAEAIVDPSSIIRGVIVKVIVVVVLIRAIQAGVKHREFVRERGLG